MVPLVSKAPSATSAATASMALWIPYRAATTSLRSLKETKSRPLRKRWTMQVYTLAFGKTAVIASGKPFRPSTTAISRSSTPWFSFMTRSQNLAPSFCSSYSPGTSLPPSWRTPSAICTALLRTVLVATFDPQGVRRIAGAVRRGGGRLKAGRCVAIQRKASCHRHSQVPIPHPPQALHMVRGASRDALADPR